MTLKFFKTELKSLDAAAFSAIWENMSKGVHIAACVAFSLALSSQAQIQLVNNPTGAAVDTTSIPGFTLQLDGGGVVLSKNVADSGLFLRVDGGNSVSFNGSGTSVQYSTGTSIAPPVGISGDAASVRSSSFDAASYFTSSGSSADTTFALRLGNGVNPSGLSSSQIQVVPEPTTLALGALGLGLLAWRRHRSASQRA